ncbi:protoporphyrinogen oxidase [Bacillus alveayuensis]|uniref:protoporphyrinogen oxidase n=1 Tax=Aeribacillus alveayuensis TaxID=279215 RepID=UPI0005D106D6|nr:protoporphyrinogen oxidase [Bacillus alveayuensis]
MEQKKKVVIIGGGITGISAAFYLQKKVKEKELPVDIYLIEAKPRLGGKIETVQRNGFTIERGPDSFLERKKSAQQLVKDVGLESELVNNSVGQSYIFARDRLHPIPEGAVMGIPTNILPFLTSSLFSLSGKLRAAGDFVLPAKEVKGDQSLGQFFRRRFGDEVVEHLIEPLLSGIYAGDIDQLSLMSTFPHFYEMEQKHRSLIFGLKKSMPRKNQKQPNKKKGIFQTVKTGLQSIVKAVENRFDEVHVKKGIKVTEIERLEKGYRLHLSDGSVLEADSLIISTGHQAILSMFKEQGASFTYLKNMPATSVATVAMAFPEDVIKSSTKGTGFVIARNSGFTITACTWTHKKWPHTAPKGKALLRAYVGKAGDEAIVEQSDEIIVKTVLDDLNRIMRIEGKPEFSVVSRLMNSMPQYLVGHNEKIKEIRDKMATTYPGVYLTGSSFEGLGIPDCIDQGKQAVRDVLQFLRLH